MGGDIVPYFRRAFHRPRRMFFPIPAQTFPMLYLLLFLSGGALYVVLELFWRGHSHVSMALAGGTCLVLLYGVFTYFPALPLFVRALMGAAVITAVEYVTGAVVNVRLRLHVWDYSALPYNCYGQICLRYSLLWLLLSVPAAVAVDLIARLIKA